MPRFQCAVMAGGWQSICLSGWYRGYLARNKAQQVITHTYRPWFLHPPVDHIDFNRKVIITHNAGHSVIFIQLGEPLFQFFVDRKDESCSWLLFFFFLFISLMRIPFQGVFPASFVHLKEVIIEKQGWVELKCLHLFPKVDFYLFVFFNLLCFMYFMCAWPQRWGGGGACRDAAGEGGDHHTEGVGKHMEAALCGKKKQTGKNPPCVCDCLCVSVCLSGC